jgi:lathosterol oxidase
MNATAIVVPTGGILCQGGLAMQLGIPTGESFLATWLAITLMTLTAVAATSGTLFFYFYAKRNVTYEKWAMKTNPQYPSAEKVRDEIVQMLKGIALSACCPALAIYLTGNGVGQAYCGMPEGKGVGAHLLQVAFIIVVSEVYEWAYHMLGHTTAAGWHSHKDHHVFHNPSPFSVISDSMLDQFMRAILLLVLPMVMPINVDVMFLTYAILFYSYGAYLHWGYELEALDAHHPWINTSYHHYIHHARSVAGKPYHCAFFVRFLDMAYGSVIAECYCVKCQKAQGKRTRADFAKISVPDYGVLLSPAMWLTKDAFFSKAIK